MSLKIILRGLYLGDRPEIRRNAAKRAVETHQKLKDIGIPVFNTYRLEKNAPRVLMTNGNSNETVLVNVWNEGTESVEDFGQERIEEVKNFQEWIDGLFEIAVKSAENGVNLDDDCAFFILTKDTGEVDTIIGDLDRVSVYGGSERQVEVLSKLNLEKSSDTLVMSAIRFLQNNVKLENVDSQVKELVRRLREFDQENNIHRI